MTAPFVSAKSPAGHADEKPTFIIIDPPADNIGNGTGAEQAADSGLEYGTTSRIPAPAGDDVHQLPRPLPFGAREILLEPSACLGGGETMEVEGVIHTAFERIERIMAEGRRATPPRH
jgi:hypothetical protein